MPTPVEADKRVRDELLDSLETQLKVEAELVALYEKTESGIKSRPVKHLLHMISLDSRKHIDICQTIIDVIRSDDVLQEEKTELVQGLKAHLDLEKGTLERLAKVKNNQWVSENQALKDLVDRVIRDEEAHVQTLMKLRDRAFFRIGRTDMTGIFNDLAWFEERYRKFEQKRLRGKQET